MGVISEEVLALTPAECDSIPTAEPLAEPFRRDATLHWVFLMLTASVLALAFLLRAPGGDIVLIPVVNRPLPGVCTFKRMVGVGCPGCGLTRCFVSLAHGDLAAAWRFNPAGILLFAAAAFQIPFRIFQIRRLRRGLPEWRLRRLDWCLWLILFALTAQWIGRLVAPGWL